MTAEIRKEVNAMKQNGFSCVSWIREYKHTRLSKVHVSGYVGNIYIRLVKERMSYALHNGRGLIIMQMRTKVGN